MKIDDEMLMAYADGELSVAEGARVEAAMAADPSLAAKLERMRQMRRRVHDAYAGVLDEPAPERLTALLADGGELKNVADLSAARERRGFRFGGPPAWAAMAASLIVGVLVGRGLAPEDMFDARAQGLYAGAALERALDGQLSDRAGQGIRVNLSFRMENGGYCRTFTRALDGAALSGLACRAGDGWAVRVATQEYTPENAYRQAGAPSEAVMNAVDALIAGEPLDIEQERAARARGWRS